MSRFNAKHSAVFVRRFTLIDGTTGDSCGIRRVTFTATAGGTYYVSADAYQDGIGAYALPVEKVM